MERLTEIDDILHELLESSNRNLLLIPELNEVTDDIMRKLRWLYDSCQSSSASDSRMLTPPLSSCGSSCADSSDNSEYEAASSAFENQIYSRCVQIVENTQKHGVIDIRMVTLAHRSYQSIVNEADDVDDATKFAVWWNQFLEKAEQKRPSLEKARILDYRLQSLERLFEIAPLQRLTTAHSILSVCVESYKLSSSLHRPFHPKTLRKLEILCDWLEKNSFTEIVDEKDCDDMHIMVRNAIQSAQFDAKSKNRKINEADELMCVDILRSLSIRFSSCEDQNDSGYSDLSLPRSISPTPSDEHIVLRM